eukprot:2404534-Rhodomonas_salina.1
MCEFKPTAQTTPVSELRLPAHSPQRTTARRPRLDANTSVDACSDTACALSVSAGQACRRRRLACRAGALTRFRCLRLPSAGTAPGHTPRPSRHPPGPQNDTLHARTSTHAALRDLQISTSRGVDPACIFCFLSLVEVLLRNTRRAGACLVCGGRARRLRRVPASCRPSLLLPAAASCRLVCLCSSPRCLPLGTRTCPPPAAPLQVQAPLLAADAPQTAHAREDTATGIRVGAWGSGVRVSLRFRV